MKVVLAEPRVRIDTNHLECVQPSITMGRKAGRFCRTEVGARHVAILLSLIATCRLHEVDPYDYLLHVLTGLQSVRRRGSPTSRPGCANSRSRQIPCAWTCITSDGRR
ncbi:MAG: transposase domain-containing protein [Rhodocyclaceae bacterium]|nr:transposase domain-containing protein [Rhodocyclaceae bacterium]